MKKYGYWIALLALIAFNLYVFYPTTSPWIQWRIR